MENPLQTQVQINEIRFEEEYIKDGLELRKNLFVFFFSCKLCYLFPFRDSIFLVYLGEILFICRRVLASRYTKVDPSVHL